MFQYIVAIVLLIITYFILAASRSSFKMKVALDPKDFKAFELVKRTTISADTYVFRFALDDGNQTLGLPIGQHIVIRAAVKGEDGKEEIVQHSYTPISSDEDKGYVEFLVKVYFPCERFPKGGRLTQHMYKMEIGDKLEMRGPQGKFTYLGNGDFEVDRGDKGKEKRHVDAFAMIAGGSGITPMMQIIRAIERDAEDPTQCFLVFGNQTVEDILLRQELDQLAKVDKRFHIWYTVDRDAPADWAFSSGFVSEEMIRAHVPVPESFGTSAVAHNKDIKSAAGLMCGPPPMIKFAAKPNLEKAGYKDTDLFTF